MTMHLSARLAWHADGWNGCVCADPAANTWCAGAHSYPGDTIRELRDLSWETQPDVRGAACAGLDRMPPCMYSINAFGSDTVRASAEPPDFFFGGAERVEWDIPPATVCVWPYEEMYGDHTRPNGHYDYDIRLKGAVNFFSQFESDKSLIVYYANYSNPFSEEEHNLYAVVGISRVRQVSQETLYYRNCTPEVKQKYAGGFVWQRPVTSHYPDQGLRIPYHRYKDQPEILSRLLVVPDNPRNFKFATRAFSDDDALVIVERLLETVGVLQEIGDTSEDWDQRRQWLESLVAELWRSRGLLPGTTRVFDFLGLQEGISWFKAEVLAGREQQAHQAAFSWLSGSASAPSGLAIPAPQLQSCLKRWLLLDDNVQVLLRDILCRFDLQKEQIAQIADPKRAANGILSTVDEMIGNPYTLCEEYVGNDPDDVISLNRIDHGVFPSPELGGKPLADKDDWRRLRALCVDRLKRESKHCFLPVDQVIHDANHWLSFQPEWKRCQFTENYLKVDADQYEKALVLREADKRRFVYLRAVYEDEREIQNALQFLANGPGIALRSPVTLGHWRGYLEKPDCSIATKSPDWYADAIAHQATICERIFPRPLSVLSGAAGTGKTTVIKAVVQAVEKAHGKASTFQLLAPTGKAADRLRELTGKPAATLHSFLARHHWLNDNLTFKRTGGQKERDIRTYIIDETSMLDLGLAAAFFRAVDWQCVERLILVGDPNQLPPIGRGRFFADVIDWLRDRQPEAVAVLDVNMRQKENELDDQGTGILRLAQLYTDRPLAESTDEAEKAQVETLLALVHEGGDVDKDLRVLFWQSPEELATMLLAQMTADAQQVTGKSLDPERPYELWNHVFGNRADSPTPEAMQVITPYRGEQFGTENLNLALQQAFRGQTAERFGMAGTITIGDKVIQVVNRPKSNPLHAWSWAQKSVVEIEVFNGELGVVAPHGLDKNHWLKDGFRLERFWVKFSRKADCAVSYGKRLGKDCRNQDPEANLELAYAISIHKAQGSEFERVFFVVPKHKTALLSRELFYTGMTRARRHCTLLVEEDVGPLLTMRRREKAHLLAINSSLFAFRPVPDELLNLAGWYEEGRIHHTLTPYLVRSKSEVIVANLLHERGIDFFYEKRLTAPDGTFYLPDFTIIWRGQEWYWEHVGNISDAYRQHWETKKAWYDRHFPGRLLITNEGPDLTTQARDILERVLV